MQAPVLPDVYVAIVGPPHGELAAEQLAVEHMTEGQILARGDRVPVGGKRFDIHAVGITP